MLLLQGSDHLTVTWKVAEGTLQHIDVREEGKENVFSLGRSLWIGNEVCQCFVFCFLVVSASAVDCLERLISEKTCYMSSVTLSPTHSVTH